MKLLLERADVNPNLSGVEGRTPLLYAASREWMDEGIVKLLLERRNLKML